MKTLKLVALIDGEETDVGRCHPGQARIMQKKGLADFRDGKLYLRETVPPVDNGNIHINVEGMDPMGVLHTVNEALRASYPLGRQVVGEGDPPASPFVAVEDGVVPVFKPRPYRPAPIDEAALEEAGVEPGEWMDVVKERAKHDEVKDVWMHQLSDLLRAYRQRIALGHRCYAHDDMWNRHVGFVDEATSEFCYVTITELKEARLYRADAEPFGIPAAEIVAAFKTVDGRTRLFGVSDLGDANVPPPDDDIEWDPAPVQLEEPEVPVGLHNLLDESLPPPLTPDETVAERAERKRAVSAASPVVLTSAHGWTHFAWPDAYPAIPVTTLDPDGNVVPFPTPPPPNPRPLGRTGFVVRDLPEVRTGVYKRAQGRLYRVWTDGSGWDVSVLQEDGTYRHESSHTSLDVIEEFSGKRDFAAAGFRAQLDAAEEMITSPDPMTRAKQVQGKHTPA